MEVNNNSQSTQGTRNSVNNGGVYRNRSGLSWRPSSFINVANQIIGRSNHVLDTTPEDKNKNAVTTSLQPAGPSNGKWISKRESDAKSIKNKSGKNTIVNIVLVEAKGLPDAPGDRLSHGIHCKFRLGSQSYKSKSVPTTHQPQWRERFKLHGKHDQLLQISLWDKGKQKNFMGSCVIDLSTIEIERTHDIWQELEEGYGSIHLSITICTLRNLDIAAACEPSVEEDWRSPYAFYNVSPDLKVVGQMHVKVIGARGLYGKPNAYCTLELDNEKVQTPKGGSTSEPVWNKTYVFNIFDVASVLEVKVHDSSINSLINDFLGRVSIPLLRISDGETRWYALKDNNKRRSARGNCPRIRLEISLVWNPVTASLKLFRPKQVKYISKPPKFDIPLIYKNVKFIRDTFDFLFAINESFKRLFEWEDQEFAYVALLGWLIFWYFFEPWMGPLLIAASFPLVYFIDKKQHWDLTRSNSAEETADLNAAQLEDLQDNESVAHKIKGLPEMTFAITDGIEYMVSVAERLYNLAAFKVPYLTFLAMILLVAASGAIYFVPMKYQMMAFGLYKFLRKRINPKRVLNNDLLDFISRIPDNKILKDWHELSVPEPHQKKSPSSSASTPSTPSTPLALRKPGTPITPRLQLTPTTPRPPDTPTTPRLPSTPTPPSQPDTPTTPHKPSTPTTASAS